MRLFGSLVRLCVVLLAAMLVAQARDVGDMSSTEITALQQCLADGGCYQGAIDGQASPALQAAIRACPSQDPIVRIETGMHVATLNRISVDEECHIAATASDDKTVRVWSLPEGKLLRTLRGSRRVIVGRAAPNKNGMGARGERRPNRKSSITEI